MRIIGVNIQDYASFADTGGTVSDIGRTSVIIGRNNAGKSNVLRALRFPRDHFDVLTQGGLWQPPPGIAHQSSDGESIGRPTIWLSIVLSEGEKSEFCERISKIEPALTLHFRGLLAPYVRLAVSARSLPSGPFDQLLTLQGDHPVDQVPALAPAFQPAQANVLRDYCKHLRAWIGERMRKQIVYLGGWRNIGEQRSLGKPIVQSLREWKSPPPQQREQRQRFDSVTRLFRELTGMTDAELVPEPSAENLNISWRGRYLSLLSFGDGFQHLLIIAFELTVNPSAIFLLEEIETHLHPEVQRRLMRVFNRFDECQVVMSSHAPAVLDTGAVDTVFRAEHDGESTTITRCETRSDLYSILDQLGVKPSDLLQANVVLWVEGPSDRVLLLDAIRRCAPDLLEGVHFAFAYYAGKLRKHVGVNSDEQEVIDLLRLGRNVAMMCDSDRDDEHSPLAEAKLRLEAEVRAAGGVYWVTAGREIENYLPDRPVTEVYRELTGDPIVSVSATRFDRFAEVVHKSLDGLDLVGKRWVREYDRAKVEMMAKFVARILPDDVFKLDWNDRIQELVEFVRRKNAI